MTKYGIYGRATPRHKYRLVAIMLDKEAAQKHADNLKAQARGDGKFFCDYFSQEIESEAIMSSLRQAISISERSAP